MYLHLNKSLGSTCSTVGFLGRATVYIMNFVGVFLHCMALCEVYLLLVLYHRASASLSVCRVPIVLCVFRDTFSFCFESTHLPFLGRDAGRVHLVLSHAILVRFVFSIGRTLRLFCTMGSRTLHSLLGILLLLLGRCERRPISFVRSFSTPPFSCCVKCTSFSLP